MPSFDYIDRPDALADLCAALADASWVALDTEFMRERTYFARPCLIQLATADLIVLVDPLALEDVGPLLAALSRRALVKVLHAARQDLELFFDLTGKVPGPVFDTQIAAAFLGYDDQVSYAAVVEAVTGVMLDKSQTRTDWSLRPLRPEQLRYAEADVRHLRDVYAHLRDALTARGRLAWVEAECARLERVELYANAPETIHLRFKQGQQFPPSIQQVLRALLAWRERAARAENLPRSWVARDAELVAVARALPETAAQVTHIAGLTPGTLARAHDVQAVIADARQQPPVPAWPAPRRLSAAESTLLAQLGACVRERAKEAGISPALLATRRDLEQLLAGERKLALLEGWRRKVLGDELLALVDRAV